MPNTSLFRAKPIDQSIRKNLPMLRKPGVLTVRPGYEIAGNQLTGKQAIVATVHTKKKKGDLASKDVLPDRIMGQREALSQGDINAVVTAYSADPHSR